MFCKCLVANDRASDAEHRSPLAVLLSANRAWIERDKRMITGGFPGILIPRAWLDEYRSIALARASCQEGLRVQAALG